MATERKRCSECGGEMEKGFTLDKSYGAALVSRWIKGDPEETWQGTAKTRGRECWLIQTWRCAQCGFLKSYAIEETEPPGFLTP
ncbi:MAG TPA: hypothetical protein VF717_04615 [Pyrinomonadaceae bacterium]|jgi:hypothetical protein